MAAPTGFITAGTAVSTMAGLTVSTAAAPTGPTGAVSTGLGATGSTAPGATASTAPGAAASTAPGAAASTAPGATASTGSGAAASTAPGAAASTAPGAAASTALGAAASTAPGATAPPAAGPTVSIAVQKSKKKETMAVLLFAFSLIMAALAVGGMTMTYHHSIILERLQLKMEEAQSSQVFVSPPQPQSTVGPRHLLSELVRVLERQASSVQNEIDLIHSEHGKQREEMVEYQNLLEEFESGRRVKYMELFNLGYVMSLVVRRSRSLHMTKLELVEHMQLLEEALAKAKKELLMFRELEITNQVSQVRGSMKLETSNDKAKEIEYGSMLVVFQVCSSCLVILGGCFCLVVFGYCMGFTHDAAIVSICCVVYVSAGHIWALYSTIGGVEMGLGFVISILVASIVLLGVRRLISRFSKGYTP